jgi:hypothetical protein
MRSAHVSSPKSKPKHETASRQMLWRALALLVVSVAVASAVWADWYFGLPEGAQATFVGRSKCLDCHQAQHAAWAGSHHDLAMDRATEKTVLGDFGGVTLEHYGVTSRMFRKDGKFFINTEGPDGQLADFEIKYVFGVDPLQQYMVEFDRPADMPEHEIARLQVLRVAWDTKAKKWFHLDPPDVQERLDPRDDLHWTGVAQRWNNMCADCHSTNLQKNFDVATRTYHTTFAEIDVSCEACHGPGSLHVELASAMSPFWDRERGYALAKLKGASNQGEIQACAHCHSRRRVVHGDYTAGCNYYDYFSNELLTASSYHADGQILDEVYEFGSFIQSKMHHKGIRCTDCHDPHTARLKHEGNKVCTSCHQHPAGKYDGFIHHRHEGSGAGTQCVDCHMPQTTYMAVDPRREHSFRIPRPDLSVKVGTPNACTGCHLKDETVDRGQRTEDRGASLARLKDKEYADWLRAAAAGDGEVKAHLARLDRWADEQLDKWYGQQRKREPHFAEALHAARTQAADAPQKLVALAKDRNQPAIARATAVAELAAYFGPDQTTQSYLAALVDRDPQVRSAAVVALRPADSELLMRQLTPLLADESRAVRIEAARILARLPPLEFRGQERKNLLAATDEAFAATEVDNDRAAGHLMRALLLETMQQDDDAAQAYRAALRVEPDAVGGRRHLAALLDRRLHDTLSRAQQLLQSGNPEAARELLASAGPLEDETYALREAELALVERDNLLLPDNAGLNADLGFLRHIQGWHKEAEHGLRVAHLLAPTSVRHAYSLAVLYNDTERPHEALRLIELIRRLRPQFVDPEFEALEQDVRRKLRAGPALGP